MEFAEISSKYLSYKYLTFTRAMDAVLVETFPLLYRERHTTLYGLQYGFKCGQGWFPLVWVLSAKIERQIEALQKQGVAFENLPCAQQVKQKFGSLRFYVRNSTPEIDTLILAAMEESMRTCEVTGEVEAKELPLFPPEGLSAYWKCWHLRVNHNTFKQFAEITKKELPKVSEDMEKLFKEHMWDLLA